MDKKDKRAVIKKYARHKTDVGSPEVQIAVLTARVVELTEHMKANRHDHGTRRGLVALVNRRRKLLRYLSKKSFERYQAIVRQLELRR